MKNLKILLVEDDSNERERIEKSLKAELIKEWKLEFLRKESESQFRRDFAPGHKPEGIDKFDVAVLDLMLIWERTTREPTPEPLDVANGGVENAGFRCLEILRSNPVTAEVPCVIYTHLNPANRPEGVLVILKGSDISPLADAIVAAVKK